MTKEVPLTQGYVSLVDDSDFEWLMQWKWFVTRGKYAQRGRNAADPPLPKVISMSREIIRPPRGIKVYHRNGNTLDNRRANLELITPRFLRLLGGPTGPSGYKGVSYHKRTGLWQATMKRGLHYHLGYFKTPEDAARCYDSAALAFHGPGIYLNFPSEQQ